MALGPAPPLRDEIRKRDKIKGQSRRKDCGREPNRRDEEGGDENE